MTTSAPTVTRYPLTASATMANVRNLTPLIELSANGAALDLRNTAMLFCRNNFLHIINRRPKWCDVATYVRQALRDLRCKVNPASIENRSMFVHHNRIVDMVRNAVNRRSSFRTIQTELELAVVDYLQAAQRCTV